MLLDTPTAFSDDHSNNSSTLSTATTTITTDLTTTPDTSALRRLSDNLSTLFTTTTATPDFSFSSSYADASVSCSRSNRTLPLHRCILAARSPFFKSLFATKSKERETAKPKPKSRIVKLEVKELCKEYEVGFDSVVSVLAYLYSGQVMALPKGGCVCVDDHCSHLACRPAVDFLVEVLYLSHTFQIAELVALYQRQLLEILDKVALDDLLVVTSVADICGNACEKLLGRCINIIVRPEVDVTTLEKSLPHHIVKQIIDARKEFGLTGPDYVEGPNKHVKRIHRALESDDVELLRMLLKEGHTTLDDAFALHFAVAHCDAKTITELLELGLADVNLRNQRGYTVLHIAAMRKDPKIIVALLTKGAYPTELTLDGRKALQIAKRLTKTADFFKTIEEGKDSPTDQMCIEILEQAERRDPLPGDGSLFLAEAGDDLRMKLLYLENRVALAKLLFPMEAKVAMDIAQVDGTSEFTLSKNIAEARKNSVDLNEAAFILKEEHMHRMKALSKTVELGKRYFPRCSDVLNKIMDAEDLSQLAYLSNDTPEERIRKKRRYDELQDALTKAFTEDKEEFDRSTLSSSSSSTPMGKGHGRFNFKRQHC
ncbi:BTB/POZ domain and ankyrin repeat-containing protein NPR1-like [Silene latifolia]|uniref:BTB/POZ domain and ankyrin repeat-containing protein NPR1-like n=1 Tax=Silene latifolia TaxID=37657 RepID=UPI003D781145